MKLRIVVLGLLLTMVLAGCGGDEQKVVESTQSDAEKQSVAASDEGRFEAFLKFKRIPLDSPQRAKILEQYQERESLAAVIEKESLVDTELARAELNEFRKEMLISRYFAKFLKEAVTDQAVQNYYSTHVAEYEDQKVQVAHILIRTNKKMDENERLAKLTIAREAHSLITTGQDFGEVAAKYSEDKISASKGGDLGWLKKGSIDRRFSETAFNLKPGDISEPFETQFGFHVVKLIEGPKTVRKPFEAVAGDIRYQLRSEAKKAELTRLAAKK